VQRAEESEENERSAQVHRRFLARNPPSLTLLAQPSSSQPRAISAPRAAVAAGAPDGGPPLPPAPAANPVGHLHRWSAVPSDVAQGIVRSMDETVVTDAPFDDHGADTNPVDGDPTDYVDGSTFCGTAAPCFGQGGNAKDGYIPSTTGGATRRRSQRFALDAHESAGPAPCGICAPWRGTYQVVIVRAKA